MRHFQRRAFGLFELIVAVAIIAILGWLAFRYYSFS
jgi:prepilin-type N-terminal cleavage/methylation domain-containing protein